MKHTEVSHCFKVVLFIQEIQEMFTVFLLRCVIEYFIHFIVGVGRTRFNTVQTFYFVLYPGKQRKFAIIGIFLVCIFKPSSQNTSFSIEPSFRFCKYSQSPSLSLVKNMYNGLDLPVVGRLPEVTWSNKSSQMLKIVNNCQRIRMNSRGSHGHLTFVIGLFWRALTEKAKAAIGRGSRAMTSHGKDGRVVKLWISAELMRIGRGV